AGGERIERRRYEHPCSRVERNEHVVRAEQRTDRVSQLGRISDCEGHIGENDARVRYTLRCPDRSCERKADEEHRHNAQEKQEQITGTRDRRDLDAARWNETGRGQGAGRRLARDDEVEPDDDGGHRKRSLEEEWC